MPRSRRHNHHIPRSNLCLDTTRVGLTAEAETRAAGEDAEDFVGGPIHGVAPLREGDGEGMEAGVIRE